MDVMNGDPARLAVLAIDVGHESLNFMHEPAIANDVFAAGHNDLVKRDAAPRLWIVAEEARKGAEPFRNPFGVVQPVDPNGYADAVELPTYLKCAPPHLGTGSLVCKLPEVDADGKGLNARLARAIDNPAIIMLTIDLHSWEKGAYARN